MALTGLDIFKLLPKNNCKKCGMPTCLAFAMQLAQKRAKLEACPEVSEEAKQKLAAAAAPPMRKIVFGSGDAQVQTGQETVLFRHDEKFHNPTVVAVTVSDKLAGAALQERIDAVKALQFERVGTHMGIAAVAVVNESGAPDTFAQVCSTVKDAVPLAMILVTGSPQAMAAAVQKVGKSVPLLAGATMQTADAMAKIAKDAGCPLVARAASIEELADLSEKIKAAGVEDIVLTLDAPTLADQLFGLSRMRVLSLKKIFRPLGYPTLSFVGDGDASRQGAIATSLACKFSGIVVLDTTEPWVLLPLLTAVANIYSDPQKPVQVEPKIYAIGEVNENSPVMFTTNFSLTYYTLESDVEASRVPSYILVVDTEGTSVLTAYSGDKLNEKVVAQAMQKHELNNLVKHRKLIIPGYVAVMSGKLEEATNWEVLVGPRECSMLPKYLQEVWK
jgi:acetyl-CoA decarbonylase/synthase, CODH/ACS complex subunit gamma